jgi:hypothetical protein
MSSRAGHDALRLLLDQQGLGHALDRDGEARRPVARRRVYDGDHQLGLGGGAARRQSRSCRAARSSRTRMTGSSGSSATSMRRRRSPNDSAVTLSGNSLPTVK